MAMIAELYEGRELPGGLTLELEVGDGPALVLARHQVRGTVDE